MADTAEDPKLEEIAASQDSVYDAMLRGTVECMADLVERVADTGASQIEREVEFAGQTWTVSVRLNPAG